MKPKTMAVITGDLIGSTEHPAETVDAAMQAIRSIAAEIGTWQTPTSNTRFTRFRGDGWQICVAEPALSLRAALAIAATLRADSAGINTRLSIAIDRAESLGSHDLSDAAGPVFQTSGRELDRMPKSARISLAGLAISDRDQIIARQMFERSSRWTPQQAEAMALYLHPDNPTLHKIAKALGITAQAVNYRLGGGGATDLRANLQHWEEVIERDLDDARHD